MNCIRTSILFGGLLLGGLISLVLADPCGMVPPIYTGPVPIQRVGLQKTYVFHRDGIESFVIRPGFSGSIDNFGMLIPFPTPPEIRKVGDDIFQHLANAVDPPEVVLDLQPQAKLAIASAEFAPDGGLEFAKNKVTVLKQEAVGMYEVAVLEAGSAEALQTWMDNNGYQYPSGMDRVTSEYIDSGWCFVAVKTRVGQKQGVSPQPGMRQVQPQLPAGSVFDGNVQAMGFRFKSPELVVPMRLSAFNQGDNRNVVYLLTDGPRKIRSIPEEFVVRQIPGAQLVKNLSEPLPLRILGGNRLFMEQFQPDSVTEMRKPEPKNGLAKELFTSDLLAVQSGQMSLRHEEEEKELLRIGEHFGLRGVEMDQAHADALATLRKQTSQRGLQLLADMTLTVVDGDFPRDVIARENLTFAAYRMPADRNSARFYEGPSFGPAPSREGIRKVGQLDGAQDRIHAGWLASGRWSAGLASLLLIGMFLGLRSTGFRILGRTLALVTVLSLPTLALAASQDSIPQLIDQLKSSETSSQAIAGLRQLATDPNQRFSVVSALIQVAESPDATMPQRGWAIGALAEIGGQDVDESLLNLHANPELPALVRTWAAAARVAMTRTVNGLIEKANLISEFPALGRPIGLRLVEQLKQADADVPLEQVLGITLKVPQLNSGLAPMILNQGAPRLTEVMLTAEDQNIRRLAAGYLGTLAQQDAESRVPREVVQALKFNPQANETPWDGGPLFLPGINWDEASAKELVGQLIRWTLWCDSAGQQESLQQIHNNIRSIALAQAAGYQPPGWSDASASNWLLAWGQARGRAEAEAILREQGLLESNRFRPILNQLK